MGSCYQLLKFWFEEANHLSPHKHSETNETLLSHFIFLVQRANECHVSSHSPPARLPRIFRHYASMFLDNIIIPVCILFTKKTTRISICQIPLVQLQIRPPPPCKSHNKVLLALQAKGHQISCAVWEHRLISSFYREALHIAT